MFLLDDRSAILVAALAAVGLIVVGAVVLWRGVDDDELELEVDPGGDHHDDDGGTQ